MVSASNDLVSATYNLFLVLFFALFWPKRYGAKSVVSIKRQLYPSCPLIPSILSTVGRFSDILFGFCKALITFAYCFLFRPLPK